MHSHNQAISELLEKYLPKHYAAEAVRRLTEKKVDVTAGVVRNARNGRSCKNFAQVITVLVEMANEMKALENLIEN